MTIATSVTGFFFPYQGITPGIVVGILSLVILALALLALSKDMTTKKELLKDQVQHIDIKQHNVVWLVDAMSVDGL
jgi:DNA-binding MarR family transcriptional regulator